MPVIEDDEFGAITIRKSSKARSMKASVAPSGQLRISVPTYVPLFVIKGMIASSRNDLRKLLSARPTLELFSGMTLGKSHTLLVREGAESSIVRTKNQLILTLEPAQSLSDAHVIDTVRSELKGILRKEAKHHLPHRLKYLADSHGFSYTSLRFTHASSRWGSCNNKKAISLNIGLMQLPFELIDYVLIHELAHTKHLDHSTDFWNEVGRVDPHYKLHRKQLKSHNPGV